MSKKAPFPVMSTTITGVLFIVGVLLVTLRTFLMTESGGVPVFISDASTLSLLGGLLGFLAAFVMFWALISLCLHPAIDANIKTLFVIATALLIISVLATNLDYTATIGKLV